MKTETKDFALRLRNFSCAESFLEEIDYLEYLNNTTKYLYSLDVGDSIYCIKQMEYKDYGIQHNTNDYLSLGNNVWDLCDYYDRFGMKHHEFINSKTFENFPYTVWIFKYMGSRDAKWSGYFFDTEEEAQAWVDEKMEEQRIIDEKLHGDL